MMNNLDLMLLVLLLLMVAMFIFFLITFWRVFDYRISDRHRRRKMMEEMRRSVENLEKRLSEGEIIEFPDIQVRSEKE